MTYAPHRPAGGFARPAGLACALLMAGVVGAGGAAAAPPPAIALSPTSGTPGSTVAIRGTGFCGTRDCSPVSVLFAGAPAADGIAVGRDGTFRGTFRVPGGGVVGATNVTAVQTRGDGYEVRAFATYDLVFGIGEEAELQAEINDLAAQPPGSAAPERPLRGVPLESAAAALRGETASAAPAADRPESRLVTARRVVTGRWWPAWLAIPVAAVAAAAFVLRRRRA